MQRLNLRKSLEAVVAENNGKIWSSSACPVLTLFLRLLLPALFGGRVIWESFPDKAVCFSWWCSQQVKTDARMFLDAPKIFRRHFVRVTRILSEIFNLR